MIVENPTGLPVMLLALTVLVAANGDYTALNVQTAGDCPSRAAVEEAIAGLTGKPPRGQLEVTIKSGAVEGSDGMSVSWRDDAGKPLASTSVPAPPECAERATTAAVLLAAWQVQVSDSAAPLPPAAVAVPAEKAPEAISSDAVWRLGASAITSGSLVAASAVGFGAAVSVTREVNAIGLRLQINGLRGSSVAIAGGEAVWERLGGRAGITTRAWTSRWAPTVVASLAGEMFMVSGAGFATNYEKSGWAWGATAGAELELATIGRVQLRLGVGLVGWLNPQKVYVTRPSAQVALPRFTWEASLAAFLPF